MNKLLIVSGPKSGSTIELKNNLSIGRGQTSDVRIMDSTLSRRHAMLEVIDGIWQIRDLGSSNGTYVNDVKVRDVTALQDGDAVRLGSLKLNFISEMLSERIPNVDIKWDAEAEGATNVENVLVDV